MTFPIEKPQENINPFEIKNTVKCNVINLDNPKIKASVKAELKALGVRSGNICRGKWVFKDEIKDAVIKVLEDNKIQYKLKDGRDTFPDSDVEAKRLGLLTALEIRREQVMAEGGVLSDDEKIRDIEDKLKDLCSKSDMSLKVVESSRNGEVGDAALFHYLYKDKYIFDPYTGQKGAWYIRDGEYWREDVINEIFLDLNNVALAYRAEACAMGDEEKSAALHKCAAEMMTVKRWNAVLKAAVPHMAMRGEWDKAPGLLPCINGVVDLATGKFVNVPPGVYIRSVVPTAYNPVATCPVFEAFINDIMNENKNMVEFIQLVLGYTLGGQPKEEKVFFMFGADGRNGKGTLFKTLKKILGAFYHEFPSELILKQKHGIDAERPSPVLSKIENKRFAVFSETDKKRQISESMVKFLSGRDSIPVRDLFSNVVKNIDPTHVMFLQTNFLPPADSGDEAYLKRIVIIPFLRTYVEEAKEPNEYPIDSTLKERLPEEAEGILRWLVDGCIAYQKKGLVIPECARLAGQEYRKENDIIGQFIEECCEFVQGALTQKQTMTKAIQDYCFKNDAERPNKNEISRYLSKRFQTARRGSGDCWQDIQIKPNEDEMKNLMNRINRYSS